MQYSIRVDPKLIKSRKLADRYWVLDARPETKRRLNEKLRILGEVSMLMHTDAYHFVYAYKPEAVAT